MAKIDKTLLKTLEDTRSILDSSYTWVKGCESKNIFGEMCHSDDVFASRWCLSGAIAKATDYKENGFEYKNTVKYLKAVLHVSGMTCIESGIWGFNDAEHTTYDDVINILDKSIESVKQGLVIQEDGSITSFSDAVKQGA